ncbi:ribonuclease H-like domain-containing protein [Tanacetum coccineum]|uniref:Ribonuclease H-like domain-containing protein n=1 Tax=Tanacetum coccineum TaxID=301880 RepID=A0ABQ5H0N9_9ASTR
MNAVSQYVYMGLVYYENVASVWKDLQETYDKVDDSVVYNLLQNINSVKQGGSSVADYYHRLNSLCREFDALTKFPNCTCEVKCSCDASKELMLHHQLMKLMQFLMGLDDCYQPVMSTLLTRDPLPDVKDAYTTVSREESHRGIPESSDVTEGTVTNSNNKGPNPNLVCKNCGMIGHTIERCFELVGYPPEQSAACNTSSSFTTNQRRKLLNLVNDAPSGSIHADIAGRATFFNGNVWFNINFSRYYCENSSLVVKTITLGWIIDSGANHHLTVSTVGMLNVVDIYSLKIIVGHRNSTLATISHVGNLKLSKNVILYDVLVILGYCVILLFVNKLIKDSKMFVGFDEDKCNINMVMSFNVSKDLWHIRLGHLVDQVLSVLKSDLNLSKNTKVSVCETCHRVKQTREPFLLSDHKSKKLGELVHLNLWDPYRITSREGFKYF